MSLPLTGAGPSKASPFPVEVNFDGDESQFFDGGWSESGGNVLNNKIVLGAELVTNGNFATDLTGWNNLAGSLYNTFAFDAGTMNLVDTDGAPKVAGSDDDIAVILGDWYNFAFDSVVSSGGATRGILAFALGQAARLLLDIGVFGGTYRSLFTENIVAEFTTFSVTDYNIDNVTVKRITLTSILNTLRSQFGLSDGFYIDVYINAVTANTQVGAIWNYDGSNNFGMAYMDGTNLVVDKNVAGTYTQLASVAQAVTPDQILRIENPAGTNALSIKYNGVEKATPTIADASVIGNTGIALFSTEANNAISKVVIGKL